MLIIFLTILNVMLIGVVLLVLSIKKNHPAAKSELSSELEGFDLIEFQQNLKNLIEELNASATSSIKNMEVSRERLEELLKDADAKTNELKYLLERNHLRRQAEYKSAINEKHEKTFEPEQTEEPLLFKTREENAPRPKFMINTVEETVEAAEISSAKQAGRDRYQHINSLITNGLTVDEIAKVTGLSRGEIELIRNLKK
jgi:uncharacterized membrane protein